MAIMYNNVKKFVADISDQDIENELEINEEDMTTYDVAMPQQYYFILNEKMIAHWCPSSHTGSIIGPRPSSQWSTRYRKFKSMSFQQFKTKFGVK